MTEKELIDSLEILNHKLKNNLHAVGINLDVLKTKLKKSIPKDSDIFKHLEIVASETGKITDKVEKYMKYMKLNEKKRQKTDLRKLLDTK